MIKTQRVIMMNRTKLVALFTLLSLVATAQKISTASFGKGISFMSADSSMSTKLQFRMQHLFETEIDGTTGEAVAGAQLRRSRLKLGGYVFSPKLEYKAEIGLSSSDISTSNYICIIGI